MPLAWRAWQLLLKEQERSRLESLVKETDAVRMHQLRGEVLATRSAINSLRLIETTFEDDKKEEKK
jgi:hypothetical protein